LEEDTVSKFHKQSNNKRDGLIRNKYSIFGPN